MNTYKKIKRFQLFPLVLFSLVLGCSNDTVDKEGSSIELPKSRPLQELQQEFLDLRFGIFLCMGSSTYVDQDWADPQFSSAAFNPTQLDAEQWAKAAKSAGMTYGIFTTKHHDGFALWDTKTTDYGVMSSPYKKDIVKAYTDAFRKNGLRVFLYYSILDIHHNIRPGWVSAESVQFIKDQLTELFTNYGEIDALVIDGWDAFWARLSYEEIPFEEIYRHIKSLQPNCLVQEHNAGKYPMQELFYTDIKHYEQNAGQKINRHENLLPAQAGIPLNKTWFWKKDSPTERLKSSDFLVYENLIPLNEAHSNFVLGIVPNRDGLIDGNALTILREIGEKWQHPGPAEKIAVSPMPIIAENIAKFKKSNASWSDDMWISDFGNNDNFNDGWKSNPSDTQPWYEIVFDDAKTVNAVMIYELYHVVGDTKQSNILDYKIQYLEGQRWVDIPIKKEQAEVRVHRFSDINSTRIRLKFEAIRNPITILEVGIYNETQR